MNYPEKQSGTNIFTAESTTPAIAAAWARHRPLHEITLTRKLRAGELQQPLLEHQGGLSTRRANATAIALEALAD
jgi:hypothetical protein